MFSLSLLLAEAYHARQKKSNGGQDWQIVARDNEGRSIKTGVPEAVTGLSGLTYTAVHRSREVKDNGFSHYRAAFHSG